MANNHKSELRDERGVRKQEYKRFQIGKDYTETEAGEMTALMTSMIETLETVKKRGRPRKYETVNELIEASQNYFQYIIDANMNNVHLIPDVEGLCAYIEVSRTQLFEWERTRGEDFSNAIALIKNEIASAKKQLALKGKIPPIVFATDFNNNHGYIQRQSLDMNVKASSTLGDSTSPDVIAAEYSQLADGLPDLVD